MRLNVTFNSTEDVPVNFNTDNDFGLDMGSVIEVTTSDHNELINRDLADQHPISAITGLQEALSTIPEILYDTTENWRTHLDYVPPRGAIIAYSDYATIDGVDIPNFKVGDGLAYLVDLPYVGDDLRVTLIAHMSDATIHVSAEDRLKWNNKVSCDVTEIDTDEYLLAFTTG